MGRIKSTFVKTSANKIYAKNTADFTEDFNKNKVICEKYATVPSKKMRNSVVGYITRLVKTSKKKD